MGNHGASIINCMIGEINFRQQLGRQQLRRQQLGRQQLGRQQLRRQQLGRQQLGRQQLGRQQLGRQQLGRQQLGRQQLGRQQLGRQRRPGGCGQAAAALEPLGGGPRPDPTPTRPRGGDPTPTRASPDDPTPHKKRATRRSPDVGPILKGYPYASRHASDASAKVKLSIMSRA